MDRNCEKYNRFIEILKEELIPAMGCTEPIALAYAAAAARETLGRLPERVSLEICGSIIKNVKSVIVPNTGHMKGIEAAAAAGIIAGRAEKKLEVLSEVDDADLKKIRAYAEETPIIVKHVETGHVFDITVTVYAGSDSAKVRICDHHTNIVLIEKNGEVRFCRDEGEIANAEENEILNLKDIWDFATSVDTRDVRDLLERQIAYNCAIAEEGLRGNYGANIGKVLLTTGDAEAVGVRARAKAAAGSDARMNGCELPVIINSGSGNQGITCSVPVVEYAHALHVPHEQLLRALVLSNLVAIHEKSGIGTLSAYCGAVSAAVGASAAISYLEGGDYEEYIHTISNALAISSGIVCDGAKASCAAKIAVALDSALLANSMWKCGQEFKSGDGLVCSDVEKTIANIGRLGRVGMKQTNEEIIDMMINNK